MGESKRRKQQDPDYGKDIPLEVHIADMERIGKDMEWCLSKREYQNHRYALAEGFITYVLIGHYKGQEIAVATLGDPR